MTYWLIDFGRDPDRGLTVRDVCRKAGIPETTDDRWRQRHDPAQLDADRRCREQAEVEWLKGIVAEPMLDKQMLQDTASKKRVAKPA